MLDTYVATASTPEEVHTLNEKMLEKIYAAAQPGAAFSSPVVSGEYTVITASSLAAGGGFGYGSGAGPSEDKAVPGMAGGGGGGGGGGSSSRPIAAIVVGPDGVEVKPILDVSKIALAAIGSWASVALMMARAARGKKG
jgi:uncharacterized spore protein YtfJ